MTETYNDAQVRALVTSVAGNLECADCGKQGPAVVKFCSVKLGVFLCNQCYAAHRALGAHITRVKCIGLDGFSATELELLAEQGNARVNAAYEATLPHGMKPPPTPCNGCSSKSCVDCSQRLRFITDKYDKKLWYSEASRNSGITKNDSNNYRMDTFGLFQHTPPINTTQQPTNQHQQQQQQQQQASSKSKNPSDTDFFAFFGL